MSEREKYEKAIKEAGFEPFQTISEHWGVYALKDGSYLKMRTNIIKIARETDIVGNMAFNVNANITVGVIAPKNLRGSPPPRPPTPQELVAAIIEDDVGFSSVEEDWSSYQLQDGIIVSAKLIPIKISRTSIHEPSGDPLYQISHQLLIKASIPEELRKKGVQVQQPVGVRPTFIT
jgi:hypothetical protein